ncbi:oligosaccharide flippase family protein [Photobacterium sp. SDRW27]|uniref:lipopolysaccharide biosynthesis protein n=1 Tax=Photobacterium obscurum TaxID=2829490 RepID=UPI0022439A56|nr:oligosaccharide flippase family protein [Photobacterium obscurum]MCW8327898.1 oligosaccharide flippase family protein [Photobacterium obscurum]
MSALKQSAYYGVGIIMMKGVSLLMIPYITRQLSPHQFGTLESLVLLADFVAILAGMGIVEALHRFVGSSDDKERKQLISNCFTMSLCVAGVGIVLASLMLPWLLATLPVELRGYQVMLIIVPALLDGVIAIPMTLMRMQALAKWFCLVSVVKAVIQALVSIVMLELGWGIDAILIASSTSSVLLLLCLLSYQWRQMGSLGHLGMSAKILKYGGPVVISTIGLYAITGLDRWILAAQVGVESLAVYAVAVKFALIMSLLMQPFTLWWFPNRFQILQEPDGKRRCADNAMLGTNLGIYVTAAMILTVPGLIGIFLPDEYHLSASLVVGLLLVSCLKNAGDLLNLGCYSGDANSELVWIQWGCAAAAVTGYLLLIPQYGIWAAVWVLAGVYLLRLLLLYVFSQASLPLPYHYANVFRTLLVSVIAYVAHLIASPHLNYWGSLCAGGVLSVIMLVVLVRCQVFPNVIKNGRNRTTYLNIKRNLST